MSNLHLEPAEFRRLCSDRSVTREDLRHRFSNVNPDNLRRWWTTENPPAAAVEWVEALDPEHGAALWRAADARKDSKTEYSQAQDRLALTVAEAMNDGIGWLDVEAQTGIRQAEVQRLLVRAEKL